MQEMAGCLLKNIEDVLARARQTKARLDPGLLQVHIQHTHPPTYCLLPPHNTTPGRCLTRGWLAGWPPSE